MDLRMAATERGPPWPCETPVPPGLSRRTGNFQPLEAATCEATKGWNPGAQGLRTVRKPKSAHVYPGSTYPKTWHWA